jgi:hypothetical protein
MCAPSKPLIAPSWFVVLLFALTACRGAHGCVRFPKFAMRLPSHGVHAGHTVSSGHGVARALGDVARVASVLPPARALSRSSPPAGAGVPRREGVDIEVLADHVVVSADVVATRKSVYWVARGSTTHDSIWSVSLDGGPASTPYECARDGWAIESLTMDGDDLYWAESSPTSGGSFVKRMSTTGVMVETVLSSQHRIKEVAVAAPYLYTLDEYEVRATCLTNSIQSSVGPVLDSALHRALTATEHGVYFSGLTAAHATGVLFGAPPLFQTAPVLPSAFSPTAISLGGDTLYFIEYDGTRSGSSVYASSLADGRMRQAFTSTRLNAIPAYGHSILVAAADSAYFLVDGSGPLQNGAVYKTSHGDAVTLVASGIGGPGGLALSGDWLVVTDIASGQVLRVPR